MITKSEIFRNDWIITVRRIVQMLPSDVRYNIAKSIYFYTVLGFTPWSKELIR